MPRDVMRQLVDRLDGLPSKQQTELIKIYASQAGIHIGTAYSRLRKTGWSSGRRRRTDSGRRRKVVRQEVLDQAIAMQADARWALTAEATVEELEAMGVIQAGELSKHDIYKERRRRNIGKRAVKMPTAHKRMKSMYPNHVHQFDVSAGKQWYLSLRDDGTVDWEDTNTEVYRNKPAKPGKIRLMRYLLVDHWSGAIFVYYHAGYGESAEQMVEFLYMGWQRKEPADMYPFSGMPAMLVTDKGPGNRSAVVRS